MKLIESIRKLFTKPKASPRYEYVRETVETPPSDASVMPAATGNELKGPAAGERTEEIAFSHQGDLESYVRGLTSPKEAIERWISAGVLLPEETKVASQMLRILSKNKSKNK